MKRLLSLFILLVTTTGFLQAQYYEYHWGDLAFVEDYFLSSPQQINTRSVLVKSYNRNIQSIDIPETVYLGDWDEPIKKFEVTAIYPGAFDRCAQLEKVTIPKSITEIGANAFNGTAIYNNPDNWKDGALYVDNCLVAVNKDEIPDELIIPEGTRLIARLAFKDCANLTRVSIPSTVTSIGYGAFDGTAIYNNPENWKDGALYVDNCLVATKNSDLPLDLVIPEGTRLIANQAFANYIFQQNDLLETVDIPGSVSHIGYAAFCKNPVENVTLHKGTTHIGNSAFVGCTNLKEMTLPDGLTFIGNSAFNYCNQLTNVTLPEQVAYIGGNAFMKCMLKQIALPKQLTSIGDGAFSNCYQLNDVTLPQQLTKIGDETFNGCGFTELNIPAYIDTIGRNAFSGCSDMTKLTLSDGIRTISDHAFAYCNSLPQVNIPASVDSIGYIIFDNCSALAQINVDAANSHYSSQDGVLFTADKTVLMQYPSGKTTTTYNVPAQTTIIESYAFSDNQYLTEVHLPDGLQSLGYYAFLANKNLKTVYIGKETEYLAPTAFVNCTALTEFKVNAASTTYSAQDGVLFLNGTDKLVMYPQAKTGSIYNVPETTDRIGEYAFFQNQHLKEINISDNTSFIYELAFSSCELLEKVTIGIGLKIVGDNNFSQCQNLKELIIRTSTPPTINHIGNIPVYVGGKALSVYKQSNWNQANLQTLKFQNGTLRYHIYDWEEKTAAAISNPMDDGSNYTDLTATTAIPQEVTYEEETFTVTRIEEEAFKNCAQLEEITIPASVSSIGKEAFNECTSLQKVNLQGKIEVIDKRAFSKCVNLKEIALTSDTATIGDEAFSGCTALTQVNIDGNITAIREKAFKNCTNLEEISITGTTNTIGDEAFYNCVTMKKADILNNIDTIGENAFSDCSALTEITLSGKLTTWGNFTFSGCTALQKLTLNEGITTIGYGAFADCTFLTHVDLPSTLSYIESSAFEGCDAIKEITVRAITPPELKRNVFNMPLQKTTVYVPEEALEVYRQTNTWKEFNLLALSTSIEITQLPNDLHTENGRLYNPKGLYLEIFNLNGQCVYKGEKTIINLSSGIYIILYKGISKKMVF